MAQDWSGIVNTTMHKFIRQEEPNVLRNFKLLAMLQDRGRIMMNNSGDLMDWKVRYKQAPMQGFADMDTLTFSRKDRYKTAQLEWRGYAVTDMMTKMEREKNKNTEAIIKRYSTIGSLLLEDLEEQFGNEFYKDGNAANSKGIHGIESFFGTGSPVAAGFVAAPSDTYGGLTTGLGDYGGSWSTASGNVNWPSGTGDAHFDFWSPLIVDYTDAAWAASTDTWVNTALEALRYGIIKGKKNKSKKGMLDMILLEGELYRGFLELLQTEEQIHVVRGQSMGSTKGRLYDLGFTDVTNFDGVDITWEYGIPSAVGYGWCLDQMSLESLQGQLFVPGGPDWDPPTQAWRFTIDFMGNLRFASIRNFVKFAAVT